MWYNRISSIESVNMGVKKLLKKLLILPILGVLFGAITFSPLSTPVSAIPQEATSEAQQETEQTNQTETTSETTDTEETTTEESTSEEAKSPSCYQTVGNLSWIVCPVTAAASGVVDALYSIINNFLVIEPVTFNEDASVYIVWSYARNITNIIFIIFMLIIIFSQLTGVGFDNYNIKKTLPRIIIAAILVNLSFIICSLAVDASNVIGASTRGFFEGITETIKAKSAVINGDISWSQIVGQLFGSVGATAGAAGIAAIAIGAAGGIQKVIILLIPVVVGAVISLIIGLFTIALRQVVVALLIMLSPLAFVAYLLPNTEKYFQKWLNILKQMLVFYPIFSALYGASELIGWTFITNGANKGNAIEVIIGMGMQVIPLVFSFKLLKMSDTVLGKINEGLHKATQPAMTKLNDWSSRRARLAAADYDKRYQMKKPGTRNYNAGGHLRAYLAKKNAELDHNLRNAEATRDNTIKDYLNARDINKGLTYDKDGNRIFSEAKTDRINSTMKRTADFKQSELRQQRLAAEHDRAISQMSNYMKVNGINDKFLKDFTKRQAYNYTTLESQLNGKRRDDIADKQFYAKQVLEASETDENGNYKDPEAFKRLVLEGAGVNAYSDDASEYNNAINSVIANAYDATEAERQSEIKKLTSYLDTQKTETVSENLDRAIAAGDVNNIIAGINILDKRGDGDIVTKKIRNFMNSGQLKLGTEAANNLALACLQHKGDPLIRRLGKYINVETLSYSQGNRGDNDTITFTEFVTGRGDFEVGGKQYVPKYDIISTLKGTPLDQVDRTAFNAIIEAAYNELDPTDTNDMARIAELDKVLRPQMVTAMPNYASGSEQINSAINYLTGMSIDKDTGRWSSKRRTDPNRNDLRKNVSLETFYTQTSEYLRAFSPSDFVKMKSDMFAAVQELYAEYWSEKMGKSGQIDDADVRAKVKEELNKIFSEQVKDANNKDVLNADGSYAGGNGVYEALIHGDLNAIAGMKNDVRSYFGLDHSTVSARLAAEKDQTA